MRRRQRVAPRRAEKARLGANPQPLRLLNIKVFGRLKANLTNTKVSPFFAVDLGANIGLSSNEIKMANGFYFEPGFGCDFAISPKQSIYLLLGYNGVGYDYEAFDTTLGSAGHEMRHALAGKFAIHLGFRF